VSKNAKRARGSKTYLVSDLDEQDENHKNKQVVNNTNYSDDAVNNFEYKTHQVVGHRGRCGDVIVDVTRQRRVFHHC